MIKTASNLKAMIKGFKGVKKNGAFHVQRMAVEKDVGRYITKTFC